MAQQAMPRKSRLESGLFRLTCPLLVKAVDEWEGEGAVVSINEEVRASVADGQDGASATGDSLAARLDEAHRDHAAARLALIGDRLPDVLAEMSDAQRAIADRVVAWLVDRGLCARIRVVDRTMPAMAFLAPVHKAAFAAPEVEYKQADLTRQAGVDKAFTGIHVSGLASSSAEAPEPPQWAVH